MSDIADIYDAVDEPDRFGTAALDIVGRVVSSDVSTFNHSSVGPEFVNSYESLMPRSSLASHRHDDSDFVRLHAHHPLITRFGRSGFPPPTMWTDVVDLSTFVRTELYQSWYRPLGIRHQMAIKVAGRDGFMVSLALSRSRPFSEDDRARLADVLPHLRRGLALAQRLRRAELQQAVRGGCTLITASRSGLVLDVDGADLPDLQLGHHLPEALLPVLRHSEGSHVVELDGHPRIVAARRFAGDVTHLSVQDDALDDDALVGAGLTPRQASVALALAAGGTNAQIARRLSISAGTVRKHLERVYALLGVDNRAAAAAEVQRLRGAHGTPPGTRQAAVPCSPSNTTNVPSPAST